MHTLSMIACDCVAKEAQKHIDWDNNVSCEYYPYNDRRACLLC